MTLNKTQLAARLGIAPSTLRRWIDAGLPLLDSARRGTIAFDLGAVLAWIEQTGTGFSRVDLVRLRAESDMPAEPDMPDDASFFEKFQKARAASETERAILLRLEREKLEGSLVDAESVRRAAFTVGRQSMQSVMALKYRLDPLLSSESDSNKRAQIWDRELRQICSEMASARADAVQTVAPDA